MIGKESRLEVLLSMLNKRDKVLHKISAYDRSLCFDDEVVIKLSSQFLVTIKGVKSQNTKTDTL